MSLEKLYTEFNNIVTLYPAPIFMRTEHIVQGYNVHTFIYKLADYSIMSQNPISREMRGATFVFNSDNSIYRFYPSIHKFYNINENESTLLSNINEDEIVEIMVKEDGVLATFVELPNGNIVAKTKGSFDNEESKQIQWFYDNDIQVKKLVDLSLKSNIQPFFEYVDPNNKIVLDYPEKNLKLLLFRNITNMNYISAKGFLAVAGLKYPYIVKELDNLESLSDIIERCKVEENHEGYIVRTINEIYKIKTQWYFKMHRLTFDELAKENDIVHLYFANKLDDAVATLPVNMVEKRLFISKVVKDVLNVFDNIKDEVAPLIATFKDDIKSFALQHKKHELFSIAIQVVRGKDATDTIIDYILKNCKKYQETKEFLKKWK